MGGFYFGDMPDAGPPYTEGKHPKFRQGRPYQYLYDIGCPYLLRMDDAAWIWAIAPQHASQSDSSPRAIWTDHRNNAGDTDDRPALRVAGRTG